MSRFDTLLVANRGEIACRVMRTASQMGIRTVAVHSEVDASALHVREADMAVSLGGVTAAESYLSIDAIIAAARQTGAGAVHPGYGFLSENPEFVEACKAHGLIFVGPSARSMRAMGLKDAAKRLMAEAGVPVVPGYHGESQDPERLAREADAVGYPILIKARAGGGGKGMRQVERPADFAEALSAARREAAAAFGDDAVLIEKFIAGPRHVEVQVFGDRQGNVVHLFERDCSLQRRHQKVIEEAPAPGMSEAVRIAMTDAAVRAARAIDYVGAGTVEFIADGRDGLDADRFWFMEMNTRLQVEHPVTEAVTGIDLVEWQLRIAAGEPLPRQQADIALDGHAVEARLYAEDVPAGFLPATGRLEQLDFGRGGRVDTGVVAGDEVLPYYDPMLAKLVAHAAHRREAFQRLAALLADTVVLGTVTNRDFLLALCRDEDVLAGSLDTGLIARGIERLTADPAPLEQRAARAVAAVMRATGAFTPQSAAANRDPVTPELAKTLGCWQLWGDPERRVRLVHAGTEFTLRARRVGRHDWQVDDEGAPDVQAPDAETRSVVVSFDPSASACQSSRITIDGVARRLCAQVDDAGVSLCLGEALHRVDWWLAGTAADQLAAGNDIVAPMPGRIVEIGCAVGDAVETGQVLLTLEAMKMEHALRAPRTGVVAALVARIGEQVSQRDVLLRLEDD